MLWLGYTFMDSGNHQLDIHSKAMNSRKATIKNLGIDLSHNQ